MMSTQSLHHLQNQGGTLAPFPIAPQPTQRLHLYWHLQEDDIQANELGEIFKLVLL